MQFRHLGIPRPQLEETPIGELTRILLGIQWFTLILGALIVLTVAASSWVWEHRGECLLSGSICFSLGVFAAFQI